MWNNSILVRYNHILFEGFKVTLSITFLAFFSAVILALIAALCRTSSRKWINIPAKFFIQLTRNTPILVSLVWFTYALPIFLNVRIPNFWTALLALTTQEAGYMAEVIRTGLEAVGKDQRLAARSIGMDYYQELKRIVIPQAFRITLPAIMNDFVSVFKLSALVSVVAVPDMMYYAHKIVGQTFRTMETYTTIAIIYVLAIVILQLVVNRIEKRFGSYYLE